MGFLWKIVFRVEWCVCVCSGQVRTVQVPTSISPQLYGWSSCFSHDAGDGRWKFLVLPFCVPAASYIWILWIGTNIVDSNYCSRWLLFGGYCIVRSYGGTANVVDIVFQGWNLLIFFYQKYDFWSEIVLGIQIWLHRNAAKRWPALISSLYISKIIYKQINNLCASFKYQNGPTHRFRQDYRAGNFAITIPWK